MSISLSESAARRPPADPQATCGLYTYLTLPSAVFADKYQLSTSDAQFLDSHNLVGLRSVSGETDLEAPDWVVDQWGSSWLVQLSSPGQQNVTIPLHLRYLGPSTSGYRDTRVPWPVVFWACSTAQEQVMASSPFDRVDLGWEGLFGPKTSLFYQVQPSSSSSPLVETIRVPVLKIQGDWGVFGARSVETGTVLVIVLGTLWVLVQLGLFTRPEVPSAKKTRRRKEQSRQ